MANTSNNANAPKPTRRGSSTTTTRRAAGGSHAAASKRADASNGINAGQALKKAKAQPLRERSGKSKLSAKQQATDVSKRILRILLIVVILAAILLIIDMIVISGRACKGVHVGEIDVGGMNEEEITQVVQEKYGPVVENNTVYIFASEDAQKRVEAGENIESDISDRISIEEAREERLAWEEDSESLSACIDSAATAHEAVTALHGVGDIFKRISAFFNGFTVVPTLSYDEDALASLENDINETIGSPRIDFDIEVVDGYASVTEGEDGKLLVDELFRDDLAMAFISESSDNIGSFVAQTEVTPIRITREIAQETADKVNNAISDGSSFVYEGAGWLSTPSATGEWVRTKVEDTGKGYALVPYIDAAAFKSAALAQIKGLTGAEPIAVKFEIEGDAPVVLPQSEGTMPLIDQAATDLNEALFGEKPQEAASAVDGEAPLINIGSTELPEKLSFDDAMNVGLISEIEWYTTSYTYGTEKAEARNYNIHLAADYSNNSICRADGGTWSFHETVGGECNEERGFKNAGIISEGEYTDSIGGGICQVATTVFNCAYDAGYHIDRRYAHSLYMTSYPDGRDAAVNWPDLDLVWSNDTSSDILMVTSYTESTLTVSLYGVDPEREVSTYVSDFEEGEDYETVYMVDEEMYPSNGSQVKQKGAKGRSIYVERTVTDKNGEEVSFQRFSSSYLPDNELIRVGPDFEIPEKAIVKKYEDNGH